MNSKFYIVYRATREIDNPNPYENDGVFHLAGSFSTITEEVIARLKTVIIESQRDFGIYISRLYLLNIVPLTHDNS